MKRFSPLLLLCLLFVTLCSRYSNEKLIGTWSLSQIDYEFDETRHTPKMIRQIAEAEKMIKYRFENDTDLVTINNGQEIRLYYSIDTENVIRYSNNKDLSHSVVLGVYSDKEKTIRIKSLTMIGEIEVVFSKEK